LTLLRSGCSLKAKTFSLCEGSILVLPAIANPRPVTMQASPTDRYFAVAGAHLRYRDEGSGPAVLLVHGWALDLEMWNALAVALRDEFRVVRLDRRGFGRSSGQPSLERDISDLEALWHHLALGRVALLGMSQGARAVLRFASAPDSRISCMVLDGPPDLGRAAVADDRASEGDVPLAYYRALARTRGMDAFRREWATHPLIRLRTDELNARQLLDAIIRRYPGNDLLVEAADLGHAGAGMSFDSSAAPVLVITGEYDLEGRVKAADVLAQRFSHAERAVIADAAHLPNLDNPMAYNALVRAFFRRHAAAAL
jgi:pimeloyl-ACP methyl ester carboxylesterase